MHNVHRSILSLPTLSRRPQKEWEDKGWWGQKPLWKRVKEQSYLNPNKMAVIDETGHLTYSELWQEAVRCSSALNHANLQKGNIVLIQLPNWREFCSIMIACELANIIFAFCPITWGFRECSRAIKLLKPSIWITTDNDLKEDRKELLESCRSEGHYDLEVLLLRSSSSGFKSWEDLVKKAPLLDNMKATRDSGVGLDPLEIAVTSGTTGDPKGVVHSHDTALLAVQSTINRQGISSNDVIHLALPVGHTFGYFYGVRCAFQASCTLVMQEKWDVNRMAKIVQETGGTIALGTAAFIIDIINAEKAVKNDLKSIWLFTQSGDNLTNPVIERAIKTLPFRVSRALGMTEFGHITSTDANTSDQKLISSTGSPQKEMEILIADNNGDPVLFDKPGRILVRGPSICAGYLQKSGEIIDVVDELGFFDTGDIGCLDAENFLRVTGRGKNVLRRGAETIPLTDLEEVLCSHPDIGHAVVVGIPDDRLGELPLACIQMRGSTKINISEIQLWFQKQGITRKFWPKDIHIVDCWPKGPTGKIDGSHLLNDYMSNK